MNDGERRLKAKAGEMEQDIGQHTEKYFKQGKPTSITEAQKENPHIK